MAHPPIAIQLYSVREPAAEDFPKTLKQLADMGYAGVEFAGYHNHTPANLRKILDDLGLKCAGTHTRLDALADDQIEKSIDDHLTLGTRFLTIPWLPEADRADRNAWLRTAQRMTDAHEKLKTRGLRCGFHCHAHDMKPLDDAGISGWDLVAQNTPGDFVMQYDTANALEAGADPVAPIRQYPGRAPLVHLKEYKGGHGKAVLGDGDVPWQDVFAACDDAGPAQWYIIEFEKSVDGKAPLAVAEKSQANLRNLLR